MPRRRAEEVFAAPEIADGVFARLQASIDPDWIDEALDATGTANAPASSSARGAGHLARVGDGPVP
jgi:hypothetical protein